MYELNTSWVLWYHSIKDTSWTKSSYKQMFTFTTIYDYSIFEDVIQLNHLQNATDLCALQRLAHKDYKELDNCN